MFNSFNIIKIYKEHHTNFRNGSLIITKMKMSEKKLIKQVILVANV